MKDKRKSKNKKKKNSKNNFKSVFFDLKKNIKDELSTKSSFNIFEVIVIIFISILFGIVVGYIITYSKSGRANSALSEITTTYNNILDNYYGKVDENSLSDAAIKGMIESLNDPHSNYMDSETTEDFNQTVDGSFVGIGVTVMYENDYNVIIALEKDGPAEKAGVKVNDIILAVDDTDVKGMYGSELTKLIRGEVGSKVTLMVKRGEDQKKITVKRDTIEIKSVTGQTFDYDGDNVGYLRIKDFAANTASQFSKELKRLEKKNIDSLVIDVRDNPGGHLTQVKEILSMFFDKKTVLYQIQSKNNKRKVYSLNNEKRDYPIAILINGGSASASEILASTFKENYKNAVIVGKRSYGKGSVQKSKKLSDGTSIKYTTQRWLTSKGKWLDNKGVEPDLDIELSEEYRDNPGYDTDNQLQESLKKLKNMK